MGLLEGETLPHRAAYAGVHVVEGGKRAPGGWGQCAVRAGATGELLATLPAGGGPVSHQGADQRTAFGACDLTPVHPGYRLVGVEDIDHRREPAIVYRKGVLHKEGDVASGRERGAEVARRAVVELAGIDPAYGGA